MKTSQVQKMYFASPKKLLIWTYAFFFPLRQYVSSVNTSIYYKFSRGEFHFNSLENTAISHARIKWDLHIMLRKNLCKSKIYRNKI